MMLESLLTQLSSRKGTSGTNIVATCVKLCNPCEISGDEYSQGNAMSSFSEPSCYMTSPLIPTTSDGLAIHNAIMEHIKQ